METIRKAAVAGAFYPDQPEKLRKMVNDYIHNDSTINVVPKAIISPHAGYIYSGAIAGKVYSLLESQSSQIKRVILMGPPHRTLVVGLALSGADYFETPLGRIPVDPEASQKLLSLPTSFISEEAHLSEHSLEVQLPFLQQIFSDFSIIPFLAANIAPESICLALEALVDQQSIIVVSSDLSHFHGYDKAKLLDHEASEAIKKLRPDKLADLHACGSTPIRGLLCYAQKHGLKPDLVAIANSGDTAGSRDKVVGYGAYAFS